METEGLTAAAHALEKLISHSTRQMYEVYLLQKLPATNSETALTTIKSLVQYEYVCQLQEWHKCQANVDPSSQEPVSFRACGSVRAREIITECSKDCL